MNILFTNAHPYLNVHEAFRLDTLDKLAQKYGFIVFARITSENFTNYSSFDFRNTHFSSRGPSFETFKKEVSEIIKKYKPKKVMNNIEYYFPWDAIETDAEKIYFVRSCMAKLLSVATSIQGGPPNADVLEKYKNFKQMEEKYLNLSDRVITDSPNSKNAILEMYPQYKAEDISLALEYVNPAKYLDMPVASDISSTVYSIGRADYQKGLYNIKHSSLYDVCHIGNRDVDDSVYISSGMHITGFLTFEQYKDIIQPLNYGLFPSIWESNGYTVQEAFAMGKIPIIQKNSGGNERHATSENSIIIDFREKHWDQAILETKDKYRMMQDAAKETITQKMYEDSLEKWIAVIC